MSSKSVGILSLDVIAKQVAKQLLPTYRQEIQAVAFVAKSGYIPIKGNESKSTRTAAGAVLVARSQLFYSPCWAFTMSSISIVIVDDHVAIRSGLRALLSSKVGWKITGEACDGYEAVEAVRILRPELIIADITMPRLNGLDAIPRMLRASPKSRVLVLTMHEEEELIQRSLEGGASAFVLKSDDEGTLVKAVESVLRGQKFVSPSVSRIVLNRFNDRLHHRRKGAFLLTQREQEVVQLLSEGYGNKQVAGLLKISIRTAENHRARVSKKLGVSSLSGLVRYAVRNHLIQP